MKMLMRTTCMMQSRKKESISQEKRRLSMGRESSHKWTILWEFFIRFSNVYIHHRRTTHIYDLRIKRMFPFVETCLKAGIS